MQAPTLPFWFKQRQGKAEPAGDQTFRLTAPNLGEMFIAVRPGDHGRWGAALKATAAGPDLDTTAAQYETAGEAWQAAFELYRVNVVT